MRGEIYLAQKKKDLAKRDFEKAISLGVPCLTVFLENFERVVLKISSRFIDGIQKLNLSYLMQISNLLKYN